MEQQAQRAQRVVGDLIERHGGTDDRVAIVSHGGFYNFVLAELLGTQAETASGSTSTTPASRVSISKTEGIGLAYANRLEHLPAELIT